MKPASDPDERAVIGRYELLFELATGGMGRVFVARQLGDAGFERIVALKRVHPHLVADPDVYGMASDEARLTALLHHPNIVPVIDVVDAKGELVLVMEYVEGASLGSLLRSLDASQTPSPEGRVALAVASRIVIDTLRGLASAHAARDLSGAALDLVHRDVSPQNLLVGTDGTTRLIDFGIARAEGRITLTKSGVIKGKVLYMAPERLEEGDVDKRSDLFSVGAVLFELIAGKWAFGVGDEAAQMTRILLGEIDFAGVRARAPHLVPVVERALARSPRDRFQTADEFARALALAEPPAEPDAVAAFLIAHKAPELEKRRARIAEEVFRRLADGPSAEPARGDESTPKNVASEATDAATSPRVAAVDSGLSGKRRSRPWVLGLGIAALIVNTIGWYAITRPGPNTSGTTEPSVRRPGSPSALAVSAPASDRENASAAQTPSGASSSAPVASIAPAASVTVPAATSPGRPTGLEPSPYGSGLRKSPYKAP